MNENRQELLKLLEAQFGHYQKLSDLIQRERSCLIKLDLDALMEIAKAKETTALKIKLLIEPLAEKIRQVALETGLPAEPLPTLADLAGAVSRPWSDPLREAGQTLARLKNEIARHNEDNGTFIQDALGLVTESLSILTGAAFRDKDPYLSNGHRARSQDAGPTRLSREV